MPTVQHSFHGVFLHVIDDAAFRLDAFVALEHIDDQPGSLELVLKVRCVDENHLVLSRREVHVHFQHLHFIARIFVQPDFANPEHVGFVEEFGDQRDDVRGQFDVLGFLRVNAQPGEMRQSELRGAIRLMLGQLAEVIVEAVGGRTVKAGPERRLANSLATGGDHGPIIVGRPADHVSVGFDVSHESVEFNRRKIGSLFIPSSLFWVERPTWPFSAATCRRVRAGELFHATKD